MAAAKKSKIPTPMTIDGFNGRPGHVSLAREEYDAFAAREEVITDLTAANTNMQARAIEMRQLIDAQVKILSSYELKARHLERIIGLQAAFIDSLKDKEKTLGLSELSEFWKRWLVATSNEVDARKVDRTEVEKFEPNLFKMWRNWVNDHDKVGRGLNFAGTRAEVESAAPKVQQETQAHMIRRLNEENAKLAARVVQLEAEIGPLKGTP